MRDSNEKPGGSALPRRGLVMDSPTRPKEGHALI